MLFVPCLPMPSTERHLPNRRSAKPRLNAMATDSASESREREFASHSLSNDVMTSLAGINDKRLRLLVSAAVAAAPAFARSVELRPAELLAATEFLTSGAITRAPVGERGCRNECIWGGAATLE